jgi:uncharacterized protein (DUF2062 family)
MGGYIRRTLARFPAVLHFDDPPGRLALALAVGVFISCTPFYGLQTVLSVLVATLFGLNKAATVTGTWLNLPWFTPFVYSAALAIGGRLVPDLRGIQGLSVALLLGTTIVGVVAAATTYAVAFGVISHRRSRARAGGAGSSRQVA